MSIGTCRTWVASSTPTRPTRLPGRPAASPSRACSPRWLTSSAASIPIGPFALIGDDDIGKGIVATLRESRSPAVLMQNHGVFAIGSDAKAAVKAAVMCEDVARTVHISRLLGDPLPIAQPDIDRLYDRYQNAYGQRSRGAGDDGPPGTPNRRSGTLVPHRQPGDVRRGDAAPGRRAVPANRAIRWTGPATFRSPWSGSRYSPAPKRSAARCLDATTDGQRASASSPGCTRSPRRRCGSTASTPFANRLLHLHTQAEQALPWATIDMDFMNLNQAAHGDREFGYIQTRLGISRKIVAGHVDDAEVRRRVSVWARAAVGNHESRHLRLARFGDNMRDVAVTEGDKVGAQAELGVTVTTYGVNDLVAVVDQVSDADIDLLVKEYDEAYDVVPELRRGGERHDSLRYGARLELGIRQFLDRRRRSVRSPRTSRISAGFASCPGWPFSA